MKHDGDWQIPLETRTNSRLWPEFDTVRCGIDKEYQLDLPRGPQLRVTQSF